jgi:hypothetical protein
MRVNTVGVYKEGFSLTGKKRKKENLSGYTTVKVST